MQPVWALWALCMGPPMAVLAGMEPGTAHRAGEGRLSWPVFLLTLAAVTSSSLSALSLYQLVALRAEVEGLKSEVCRRREEGQDARHRGQVRETTYPLEPQTKRAIRWAFHQHALWLYCVCSDWEYQQQEKQSGAPAPARVSRCLHTDKKEKTGLWSRATR